MIPILMLFCMRFVSKAAPVPQCGCTAPVLHYSCSMWLQVLQVLQQYVEDHGHIPQKGTVAHGIDLAKWCCACRQRYKAGKLDQGIEEGLNALPGWSWDVSGAGECCIWLCVAVFYVA